jgi:hypothetical protein
MNFITQPTVNPTVKVVHPYALGTSQGSEDDSTHDNGTDKHIGFLHTIHYENLHISFQ